MTIHVALSGGMDSTSLLAYLTDAYPGVPIRTYGFNYGQRHAIELRAATQVADHYGVPFEVLDLPRLSSPALTDGGPVPHGHYAHETMTLTVVQGRNLLFASTLIGRTQPRDAIAVGVHSGDHAIYPDCRPSFWQPFATAVRAAYDVNVLVPFITFDKGEIARIGHEYGAPLHLTWSCYEGGQGPTAEPIHCGRCGTCVERAEAFHLAGVPDPTPYADAEFWREAVANA